MFASRLLTFVPFLLAAVNAGTIVWDGRFNDYTTATDLDKWSWSNQVGSYQWYIHGTGPTTDYVNLSPGYKNPADTGSKQGAKLTIGPTALWNSAMWRTELIPQTNADLGTGKMWYHFSVKRSSVNPPNPSYEHQVCFFESHFTELKFGWVNGNTDGSPDQRLQWFVGGTRQWATAWDADVWHNFAYEIDFSAGTVAMWHSTGAADLVLTGAAVSASTSTNSKDWHLGILRLPDTSVATGLDTTSSEDWYFSGVYVESGSINTKIGDGSATGPGTTMSTTAGSTTTVKPTTTTTSTKPTTMTTPTTITASAGTQTKWQQCGGIGWTGSTCVAGLTCTKLNDYYYQCL
ncbi:carbohydrate-binding module family 1 protein [Sphaerosporella brunnea]|uniref:Carbohydrate-binding module family 1 protein n=1 Tax=Sphaerosporella brunnea TaxID=1250544 RepID=A0A5J5EPX3_9PEZI|nr:carbohydrate-binding module family 1 protein [Sphaerosporella brunnea]